MIQERYIGLMSGSSLDGVDIAVVEFLLDGNEIGYSLIEHKTIEYSDEWSKRLRDIKSLSAQEFIKIESEYSSLIAQMITEHCNGENIKGIGVHGHTVTHIPEENISIQLGNGGIISSMTGIDTILDFRIQDIALGGKGTPLVSILEKNVLKEYTYFLNLGGIANVTWLGDKTLAYDICACNQVLNYLSSLVGKSYDEGGKMASKGVVNEVLLQKILDLEYHHLSAPKSIDNQWIHDYVIPLCKNYEINDALATVVESIAILTANGLADKGSMMITGGGAFNKYLIERLTYHLSLKSIKVIIPDKVLVDYKEAILMAYLAFCRVNNLNNVLSEVTGASQDSCSGAWYKV